MGCSLVHATTPILLTYRLLQIRRLGGIEAERWYSTSQLDLSRIQQCRSTVVLTTTEEVLELLLPEGGDVQDIANEYFNTVHLWFPVISKKQMSLSISLWNNSPDLALLFLAMKLIITIPQDDAAGSPIYTACKRTLALLEVSGAVSLQYLQAMLLVALYEYGHAIFPSAWMTIGSCARYSDFLGLPSFDEGILTLGQPATWTEAEERRRVCE